jgi:putative peptidoglycan lipid II flippase
MTDLRRRLGSLVALSGLATLVGFGTQLLVAYHFGTSARLDSYWLALAVATSLSFYVHPLRESLIGVVFRGAQSDPDRASEVLSAGVMVLLVGSCLAALVLGVGSGLSWFPSGSAEQGPFSHLLLAFLPFIFLFALSETFNAVLLSFNLAQHQAWARLLSSIVAVLSVGLLGGWLGVYALVISLLVGQLVVLAVSWQALRARGLRWRFVGFASLRNRAFVSMFLSLLLNYFLAQSYVLIERWTISDLQLGALSAFLYATLLVNVMISLLALPLSNLLWPQFLALECQGERDAIPKLAWETGAPVLFVLFALVAFTWKTAPEVVHVIFLRGNFDVDSMHQTVAALRMTLFAAILISLVTVALRGLMSQGRSIQVAAVGILMAVVGIGVLALARLLGSLPLAQAHWMIANGCGCVLAWAWLIGPARGTGSQAGNILLRILLSAAVIGFPLLGVPLMLAITEALPTAVSLAVSGLIYGIEVLLLALLCRLVEPRVLLHFLRRDRP